MVSAAFIARACGGSVLVLGAAGLAGWAFDLPALKGVVPGLATMKANTALCFLLGGLVLVLCDLPAAGARRLGRLAATLVALVALSTLIEYHAAWDLGIDELFFRDPGTPPELAPGRMAEATAWGFLMAGLGLGLVHWARPPPAMRLTARLLAIGVIALGGLSLLGQVVGLRFLVRTLPFETMALHTAAGFVVLGGGLLAALHPRQAPREDRHIAGLAALLLALVAGAAGIGSFAVIGAEVQERLAQGLGFALQSRINTITINVALRTGRAEIITSRPNLLRHLRVLGPDPDNPEARRVVQGVAESFLPHDFSGIAIALPTGVEVAMAGSSVTEPELEVALAGAGKVSLLWRDGVFLRHRLPLADAQGPLGTVLAEQPLPKLTELLAAADAPWASAELLLCRPNGQASMRCFPSRHHPRLFTLARGPAVLPPRLAYRALAEPAGFGETVDYRGRSVLGAYARVGDLGLVAVLKVDAAEIYGPIGRRFGGAIGWLLLLISIGAWLVWLRVRPLATALETRVRERTAELQVASARLAASEERLRLLFTVTHRAAWDWDMVENRVWQQEDLAAGMEGATRDAGSAGSDWMERVHPDDRDRLSGRFGALLADAEEVWNEEYRYRKPDSAYAHVLERGVVVRDETGRAVRMLGAMLDITDRKRAEEALKHLNEELDERVGLRTAELVAANEELEAFSYSVSHDLRAPLRHIDGFTGLLQRHIEPTLDEKGRRYLKTISEAAKQMGVLIDDLLTFSRIGRAELRHAAVSLQRLVDEVRRTLEPEIGGRDIVWAIAALPEVQGDPQLLRLVLQNLIGNALKYTRTRPQARIEVTARHRDEQVEVSVRDNGVGFDMRYVDRLFGVFQRLHSSAEFEGTGIGLATVRRIVHRHGGRVWAEARVDEGACFCFALPENSAAAEPRADAL